MNFARYISGEPLENEFVNYVFRIKGKNKTTKPKPNQKFSQKQKENIIKRKIPDGLYGLA